MRPLHNVAAAAMLVALVATPCLAYDPLDTGILQEDEAPFKYSISIAPTFAWPHFNKLNDSLSFSGNEFTNSAYHYAGARSQESAAGFKNISMDYGLQIAIGHEFDEEMRGGLVFGFTMVSTKDELVLSPAPSATNGSPTGYWSTTDYNVSQSLTLPLFQAGIFIHRVFRFEDTPRMNLYMGGWGNFGTLVSASLKGEAYNADIYPVTVQEYEASLTGNSWGAGLVGGMEYTITSFLTGYLEAGWDYFIINSMDRSGTIDSYYLQRDASGNETSTHTGQSYTNIPQWKDGNDNSIPLDYGGVFIRFGIRMGLGL